MKKEHLLLNDKRPPLRGVSRIGGFWPSHSEWVKRFDTAWASEDSNTALSLGAVMVLLTRVSVGGGTTLEKLFPRCEKHFSLNKHVPGQEKRISSEHARHCN